MSLYNMVHGVNPAAGLLLGLAGFEGAAEVGRFRDAYVDCDSGEPLIAIYTRNGGGNREHYAWDSHYSNGCRWNAMARTWENVGSDCEYDHEPIADEGPECDCTGCTITYRLPALENYVRDEDDDFDNTYLLALKDDLSIADEKED